MELYCLRKRRPAERGTALMMALVCLVFVTTGTAQTAGLKIQATVPHVQGAVAVRAIIQQSNGAYYPGEWGDSTWPNVALRGKAMAPDTIVQLPPGNTVITVGKGPDYYPQTFTLNLPAGQITTLTVDLKPVLDMRRYGWVAGDVHPHYNHGEGEVLYSPREIQAMSAAGGLNFISLCQEHYGAGTLTREEMFNIWAQFNQTECQVWLGAEEPKNAWGHYASIVYDPWSIRSPLPYSIGVNEVHRQGGVSIPAHPVRMFPGKFDGQDWQLFPLNNFFKAYPLQALTGNQIDAWGGISDEAYHPDTLPPFFELLNMGYRIPLLADSDIVFDRHSNGDKAPGNWVNYFQIEGALSKASVIQAIKRGRVVATTGPMLMFTIDGAAPGSILPADGRTLTGRIQAVYAFNPWTLSSNSFNGEPCRVMQVDLFRNGEIIQTWNPNTPSATIDVPITETTDGSYYMVRVLGTDATWMAAYSSPIYFQNTPRPRQPEGFTPLVNGRVYDAASGAAVPATVSCVRDGNTLWTLQTDPRGLFRAYVPLDAKLVARDASGRQIARDILNDESVYSFCHNLPDTFPHLTGSIDALRSLIREVTWEFPLGYQNAASYVRQAVNGNAGFTQFNIQSAPPRTPGKTGTEITTLLVDRTRVQPGETIHYAVIFRSDSETPNEELSVEWKAWNPAYPRLYTKHGTLFHQDNAANTLIPLGNGFFVRKGSVVVPPWAGNVNNTSHGIKMAVTVRKGAASEEANLLIRVGPSRPQLLVSSTWDGLPATWGEAGVGPALFHRQLTSHIRYADYRQMRFTVNVNGQPVTIHPIADTAHVPDADDALFEDFFFYDGQFGPDGRNINYRDPVRSQPASPDFSNVPIFNVNDRNNGGNSGGGSGTASVPLPIAPAWFGPNLGNERIVFWEHKASGKTAATYLSVTNFISATFLRDGRSAGAGWRARTVADMNGDGFPDLIWKHQDGRSAVWFMHGTEFISASPIRNGHAIAPGWDIVGSGDISGDGRTDLIWQHADGRLVTWLMEDMNFVDALLLRDGWHVGTHWRFSGLTDLDSNGTKDILWHGSHDNRLASWLMENGEFQNSPVLRTVNPSWKLVGTDDFSGDGRDDFLWQNTDGRLAIWFMEGTNFVTSTLLIPGHTVRPGWRVVGVR